MLLAAFLSLFLQNAPTQITPPSAEGDEVVVTARRHKCDISLANQVLSDADFQRRAAEWAAGRPVHVVVPPDSSTKCLVQILFKLANHGVKNAIFDDPAPAQ